jgi:VIT1/CCC1 family predicted Fe2+/Mn2+ transporter
MTSNDGIRVGLFFGTTSGVITTCGLLVGLASGTGSMTAVLGGILVIAVADSMSDALGIHLSEESAPNSTARHIWSATIATFLAKFLVACSFAVPFLFLPLQQSLVAALVWGGLLLTVLSWKLARIQEAHPLPVILEHLLVAVVVVGLSHLVGVWVSNNLQG